VLRNLKLNLQPRPARQSCTGVGGRGRGTIAARSCAVGVAAAVARVHFEFCGYGGVSDLRSY